jgi:hypothetical protein
LRLEGLLHNECVFTTSLIEAENQISLIDTNISVVRMECWFLASGLLLLEVITEAILLSCQPDVSISSL